MQQIENTEVAVIEPEEVTPVVDATAVVVAQEKKSKHYPLMEEIVDILCLKTQNNDRAFFRVEVAYYLAKMASSMRAQVVTHDRGNIPVNVYALALAVSGSGKGYSIFLLENSFLGGFHERFTKETFPAISENSLREEACKRAARTGTNEDEEFKKITTAFNATGPYNFSFAEGTSPAVKQLRQKLLMGGIGSINFEVDEIGSNLLESNEVLVDFLELYDQGNIKVKLTKNTNDSNRGADLMGKTPANTLMFGTPPAVMDGSKVEEYFFNMLEIGYARRCLFAFGHKMPMSDGLSAEEIYYQLIDKSNNSTIDRISQHFSYLAHEDKYGWSAELEHPEGIKLMEYKINCERFADTLPDHEDIKKTEIRHRYFKVLKLAGVFAFIDESIRVTQDHIDYAIELVEESGKALQELFKRDKPYIKLAKYLATVDNEQTHADLLDSLPFYKSGVGQRNEMMTLATAWGYKNHIIIKKNFVDGIEFFLGEPLEKTDCNNIIISYSNHFAEGYYNERAPFDQFGGLVTQEGYGFTNHWLANNYRTEENATPGMNMIVLDIDEGVNIWTAHELLADYKFMTYTTKRHTEDNHRFRLLIPINYTIKLDSDEFKEFMQTFLDWLPFKVDRQANQRSRRWGCNPTATVHFNDGMLLDALRFVPKTQKNEQYRQEFQAIESMDNLERWFAQRMVSGSRNNHLLKFAMILFDSGLPYAEIENRVMRFNNMLSNKLTEDEIRSTVLITVGKKFQKR